MIKVQITGEPKSHGKFTWTAEDQRLSGLSRQPLLDACRALAAIGLADHDMVGLYRGDSLQMTCTIGYGRRHTVDKENTFLRAWEEHPIARRRREGRTDDFR